MFQRILVPLDGSKRAEHALPVAIRLARASQGSIILVRIVHPPSEIGDYGAELEALAVHPTSYEQHIAEAERYLQHLQEGHKAELAGVHVEQEVETGATAETMFSVARLEQIDLIVIGSHGAHPLLHWMFRSIAREAVQHSPVPVLVVKEHGGFYLQAAETHPLRMLVPLDGSSLAEAALQPALQLLLTLAKPEEAAVHLLRVIDLPSLENKPLLRAYDIQRAERLAAREAEDYLQQISQRCLQTIPKGMQPFITWSFVFGHHIGQTLAEMAQPARAGQAGHSYDLVALATHGRTGFQRLRLGSVTEHLLGATELPLLVVRPIQPARADKIQNVSGVTRGR